MSEQRRFNLEAEKKTIVHYAGSVSTLDGLCHGQTREEKWIVVQVEIFTLLIVY